MKLAVWALLPVIAFAVPASATTPKPEEKPAAAAPEATEGEAAKACKKKGKGLGSVLRAARSSGLVSVVAGRAGSEGALVNSATNTAIDVADASNRMAPQEKPTC